MGCRVSAGLLIFLIAPWPVYAQSAPSVVHFEVASIRTTSIADARQQDLIHPLTISGRRIDFGAPTLNNLISTAFAVRPQQLIGAPSIRADEHYVIEAVMPEGAARGQMPEMLRALLEERFHLAAHRETREVKGYALVRSKHLLKLEPPRELDRSICSPGSTILPLPGIRRACTGLRAGLSPPQPILRGDPFKSPASGGMRRKSIRGSRWCSLPTVWPFISRI